VPGIVNNWSEVDIQRDDTVSAPSDTQTLLGQRQGGVHRGCRSGQRTWREGTTYLRVTQFSVETRQ